MGIHQPNLEKSIKERPELRELFAAGAPVQICSAPGRVDVLGGLGVEAGATLAQMSLPLRAQVALQPRQDGKIIIVSAQKSGETVVLPVAEAVEEDHFISDVFERQLTGPAIWAGLLVGACCVIPKPALKGMTIAVDSAIPMGVGQAAGTAIAAAAVVGLTRLAGITVDPLELALYAYRAETMFNSPWARTAHVVDVMTCLHALPGNPPHLLRFSAQPHQLVGQIPLYKDVRIVALDTTVTNQESVQTNESLRLAGAMGLRISETIYRDLGQRHTPLKGYLANLSPSLYRQYFRSLLPRKMRGKDFIRTFGELPERAGIIAPEKMYRVRTAVDHLISEHEHAENFLQAMEELADVAVLGTRLRAAERERIMRRAGRLMLASQHSYALRLNISCGEADWLVDHLMQSGPEKGVYGARLTSCGGGGTLVALLNRSSEATDALLDTLSAYHDQTGRTLGVYEAGSTDSAGTLVA